MSVREGVFSNLLPSMRFVEVSFHRESTIICVHSVGIVSINSSEGDKNLSGFLILKIIGHVESA